MNFNLKIMSKEEILRVLGYRKSFIKEYRHNDLENRFLLNDNIVISAELFMEIRPELVYIPTSNFDNFLYKLDYDENRDFDENRTRD